MNPARAVMKIADFEKKMKGLPAKERIYDFIQEHPAEIFGYYDGEWYQAFPDMNENSRAWNLYELAKENRIGKIKDGKRVFFGKLEPVGAKEITNETSVS